jgi:hypothetical protein
LIRLDRRAYEEARSDSHWFLNVPGHETAALGLADAIAERGTYVLVQKLDHAAEVVECLDDRRPGTASS